MKLCLGKCAGIDLFLRIWYNHKIRNLWRNFLVIFLHLPFKSDLKRPYFYLIIQIFSTVIHPLPFMSVSLKQDISRLLVLLLFLFLLWSFFQLASCCPTLQAPYNSDLHTQLNHCASYLIKPHRYGFNYLLNLQKIQLLIFESFSSKKIHFLTTEMFPHIVESIGVA